MRDAYDALIDAEREALSRSGRRVDKIALIRAIRGTAGLGLMEAKGAVEGYLARRGGRIPPGPGPDERPAGWIDGLLDAERADAARDDRAITKITLIRAVRQASGLGLKEARLAVEDYLRRRGGEGLEPGLKAGVILVVAACLAIVAAVYWMTR